MTTTPEPPTCDVWIYPKVGRSRKCGRPVRDGETECNLHVRARERRIARLEEDRRKRLEQYARSDRLRAATKRVTAYLDEVDRVNDEKVVEYADEITNLNNLRLLRSDLRTILAGGRDA